MMNLIAQAFDRAADSYATHSQLQQRIGTDLLQWLPALPTPNRILDIGCASGEFTQRLCQQWPQAQITAMDQAPTMLERAARNLKSCPQVTFLCQDMQQLHTHVLYDLLTANFVLQWSAELPSIIQRLQQALIPQGYLAFSVPVQGSLPELQQAWSQLGEPIPMRPLFAVQEWLQALSLNFQITQSQQLTYVEYRPQLRELLRLFKHWGADALPQRRQGLLGKNKWQQFQSAYQIFYAEQGYPMSFKVLSVLARKQAS